MKKWTLAALMFCSFLCCGFSGKIYTDDMGTYKDIKVEYREHKLRFTDWQTGNVYEFKYDGKAKGPYKGRDWDNGYLFEMFFTSDTMAVINNKDTGGAFRADFGKLKKIK